MRFSLYTFSVHFFTCFPHQLLHSPSTPSELSISSNESYFLFTLPFSLLMLMLYLSCPFFQMAVCTFSQSQTNTQTKPSLIIGSPFTAKSLTRANPRPSLFSLRHELHHHEHQFNLLSFSLFRSFLLFLFLFHPRSTGRLRVRGRTLMV